MAPKDWVTLMLSTLAFCLSGVTFYFSNLLVDDRSIVRIAGVGWKPGSKEDPDLSARQGFVVTKFAFANAGNRPAVILDVEYTLGFYEGKFLGRAITGTFDDGKAFPTLVPSRDIRLVEARIPFSSVVEMHSNAVKTGKQPTPSSFFGRFRVVSLDFRGVEHVVHAETPITIDVTPSARNPVYWREQQHRAIELFNVSSLPGWLRRLLGMELVKD